MNRTHGDLKEECKKRGIELEPHIKYKKGALIKKLAQYTLQRTPPSWGLSRRLEIESPMLCFSFKELKPEEKVSILKDGSGWIAEKKENGNRQLVAFTPGEGFSFFSRNISVEDFLPVCYTEKILLIRDGEVRTPKSLGSVLTKSFILDTEAIVESKVIDTSMFTKGGGSTFSELNAASAILALNPESSKKIQMEQASLKFKVFDVLFFDGKWVMESPLKERKILESAIVKILGEKYKLPFYQTEYVEDGKERFYQTLLKEGFEGIVLKNLSKPYVATTSRQRDVQVKLKRSMKEALGADIDAFISGFVPSDTEKSWGGLIGALKMSIFIRDTDGGETEHWVGSVSGIPLELRKKMTVTVDGKPELNPEYLGMVIAIDGQSVSAKSLRFSHCTIDWPENPESAFRKDKTKFDCVLDRDSLIEQIA